MVKHLLLRSLFLGSMAGISFSAEDVSRTLLFRPENLTVEKACFPKRSLEGLQLPSGYVHCPVVKQLQYYRSKVYDPAFLASGENFEVLRRAPIPGLFVVLENAFALAKDCIDENKPTIAEATSEYKKKYIKVLEDLWRRAKEWEGKLTTIAFYHFNVNLAYIIDCYKDGKEVLPAVLIKDNPEGYYLEIREEKLSALKNVVEANVRETERLKTQCENRGQPFNPAFLENSLTMKTWIDEKIESGYFDIHDPSPYIRVIEDIQNESHVLILLNKEPLFFKLDEIISPLLLAPVPTSPLCIVYANKVPSVKRGIMPVHFVREFLSGSYPAHILSFDPLLTMPSTPRKRNPHWSQVATTQDLLIHDFSGHYHAFQTMNIKSQKVREVLQPFYQIQRQYEMNPATRNEATILMDGLFILTHEFVGIWGEVLKENKIAYSPNSVKIIKELLPALKAMAPAGVAKVFYPSYDFYGSRGYKEEYRDWEFILKDSYLDSNEGGMKLVHDEKGSFLPGITFDSNKGKSSRPFSDLTLKEERDHAMKNALKQGYERFWDYFLKILENPPQG